MRVALRLFSGAAVTVCLGFAGPPAAPRALAVLRDQPIRFEPNRGQWQAGTKFSAAAPGYRLVLGECGATLALSQPDRKTPAVVGINLHGARPARSIEPLEPLSAKANFFLGARKENWRTGVPQYRRVRYREVYPGIDLVYYGTGQQLEFDFVVRPGADARRIRLDFRGADRLSLTGEGDLLIEAGAARLTQKKPVVYQQDRAGRRQEVAAAYRLIGRNRLGVELGAYDASREVTIDPVLAYSTLIGASGSDAVTAVKVDQAGMIWVAGYVGGSDITPPGNPFQGASGGGLDAFVAEINPAAQGADSLVFFTYFGGSGNDMALGMALDPAGNVYLTGSTTSSDFPLAGTTVSANLSGTSDAFLVKLAPSLSGTDALFYSSYLGGGDVDTGHGIDVDAQGNAYIVGTTKSSDFPITDAAYQKILYGPQDAFVSKIATTTNPPLVYSSYLGGEASDDGRAIVVAPSGMVYIAGSTLSTQFPYEGNSYRTMPAGVVNLFVSKFDMSKSGESSIVYSSYLGGSQWDELRKIALDSQGRLLLTGFTLSPDFPTTPNAMQTTLAGNADAFVTRVDTAAPPESFITYSTFLGGQGGDVAYDLAVNGDKVTLTGYTVSSDFPVTPDALSTTYGGGTDIFVSQFDMSKSGPGGLLYSTFLGQVGIYTGNAVAATGDGSIYIGGLTGGNAVQTTSNAAQTNYGGGLSDGFVLMMKK